jgi:predicted nucleic acid-binding protein
MNGRFFLDTNVFIYSLDHSAPQKAKIAEQLIRDALSSQKGVISFQVVQEFFNAALKGFQRQMSALAGQHYLHDVLRPLLSIHSSIALYEEAIRLHAAGGLSWYDSLIVAGALQAKCDVLYTEDMQHGRKFGSLKIVNPFL